MDKEEILKLLQELNEKQNETICIETKTANAGKPEKYYNTHVIINQKDYIVAHI